MPGEQDRYQPVSEHDLAYTAPADQESGFQFHSCLTQSQSASARCRKGVSPVATGLCLLLLLLLAASAAIFLLRYDVALYRGKGGFRLEVSRRSAAFIQPEKVLPGAAAGEKAVVQPPHPEDYRWDGSTLQLQEAAPRGSLSNPAIYQRCSPAVALVEASFGNGDLLRGAGIVMSSDGAVIVSSRVVLDASSISVTVGGEYYDGALIGADYASDLAVVKIPAEGLPCADFGNSDALLPGEEILVVGNPVAGAVNITDGVISACNESFSYRGFPIPVLQIYMNLGADAAGSPLINRSGQVVGIVNTDMSADYPESGGVGFAVPIGAAKPIIDELLQNGYIAGRPASGLSVSQMPESYAAYYRYPGCVYITAVRESGTAYAAGVRKGDLVVSANGQAVSDANGLYTIINRLRAGDLLTLELYRGRETVTVAFELMDAAKVAVSPGELH